MRHARTIVTTLISVAVVLAVNEHALIAGICAGTAYSLHTITKDHQ